MPAVYVDPVSIRELHTICPIAPGGGVLLSQVQKILLNYTLKQLQDRVNEMIKIQGEDAHCAAWIYTKEDCHLKDEDGEIDYENNVEDPEVVERIFDDVGNIDYIYRVIQECVDEATEEQLRQHLSGHSRMFR